MYSRDFGVIRSEGQLYNLEREYNESRSRRDDIEEERAPKYIEEQPKEKKGFSLDFLRDMKLDDLVLIGIGILLLLDSDSDNDIFVLILAFLLFFN